MGWSRDVVACPEARTPTRRRRKMRNWIAQQMGKSVGDLARRGQYLEMTAEAVALARRLPGALYEPGHIAKATSVRFDLIVDDRLEAFVLSQNGDGGFRMLGRKFVSDPNTCAGPASADGSTILTQDSDLVAMRFWGRLLPKIVKTAERCRGEYDAADVRVDIPGTGEGHSFRALHNVDTFIGADRRYVGMDNGARMAFLALTREEVAWIERHLLEQGHLIESGHILNDFVAEAAEAAAKEARAAAKARKKEAKKLAETAAE